jgi:hypothetical protein
MIPAFSQFTAMSFPVEPDFLSGLWKNVQKRTAQAVLSVFHFTLPSALNTGRRSR